MDLQLIQAVLSQEGLLFFLTVWRRSQETGGFSPGELDGAIEGHQSKLLYVRRKKLFYLHKHKMTASGQLMSTFLTKLSELDSIRMAWGPDGRTWTGSSFSGIPFYICYSITGLFHVVQKRGVLTTLGKLSCWWCCICSTPVFTFKFNWKRWSAVLLICFEQCSVFSFLFLFFL